MAATIFDEKFSSFFGGKFFIFQKIEKKVSLRFIVFRILWICLFFKSCISKVFFERERVYLAGKKKKWRKLKK